MASIDCMIKAKNNRLQYRVKYFMQMAAIAIIGEDSQIAGHTERVAYAKKILSGEASIYEFTVGVVTNSTIAGKIDSDTDFESDLEFVVNSMFNDFAGYDG